VVLAPLAVDRGAGLALPVFFYQNTGWEQYGFRFSMDWMAYLFVLLAMSRGS